MKIINVILISFFLLSTSLECGWFHELLTSPIQLTFEQKNNFEKKLSNSIFRVGFYHNEEQSRWGQDKGYYLIHANYLNFGMNFKYENSNKIIPYFNFDLMKFNMIGNDFSKDVGSDILLINFHLLNFDSDIFSKRDINWLKIGIGYGYDFICKIDKQFRPLVYLNLGYSSIKPEIMLYDIFSMSEFKYFNQFEVNPGINLYFLFDPIAIDLNADFRKIFDGPNLNILTLSAKLTIIKQVKKEITGIDYSYDELFKDFEIYICSEYKRLMIAKQSQGVICFSLGFQYLF